MPVYRAKVTRVTADGVRVRVPDLAGDGYEYGPFPAPGVPLAVGDMAVVGSVGETREDLVLLGKQGSPSVAGGTVNTASIVDGAVTEPKLADGAVDTVKVADGAITEPKLANGAVDTVKILDGSVTLAKLGSDVLLALMPTGVGPIPFAGTVAPSGWYMCDGSAKSRTTDAALFAVIGTTYGAGDGSTTFNLPAMQDRVPVGKNTAGTFAVLGATGGEQTHVLTQSELAAHTHIQDAHTHVQDAHNHTQNAHTHIQDAHNHPSSPGTYIGTGGGTYSVANGTFYGFQDTASSSVTATNQNTTATNQAATATNQNTTATNQSTGSGTAHNNLQPYLVVNYIIKA